VASPLPVSRIASLGMIVVSSNAAGPNAAVKTSFKAMREKAKAAAKGVRSKVEGKRSSE
jgi:soluble cytochrome b562